MKSNYVDFKLLVSRCKPGWFDQENKEYIRFFESKEEMIYIRDEGLKQDIASYEKDGWKVHGESKVKGNEASQVMKK